MHVRLPAEELQSQRISCPDAQGVRAPRRTLADSQRAAQANALALPMTASVWASPNKLKHGLSMHMWLPAEERKASALICLMQHRV